MSRVISTTVYLSDELSESAREKARSWYCEGG
ncbi:antitoxin of toxin-antitoxin stability system, partial [Salmonella enterica]|nr:antitoxin of toxin-antitoxin stability system [Salmonella enterica]EDX0152499.1 antitoxin of toxin-antitoxin stability system [Salmonella enterica]EEJ4367206.1 antitoxin of toxin-antitoxin stability system [Salmonella enterica subsp. enterica serovar Java]